jgi:CubicO group peptidase (beta-lactamase class C family)
MHATVPLNAHVSASALRRVVGSHLHRALRQALHAAAAFGLAASALAQAPLSDAPKDAQWLDTTVGAKVGQAGPPGAAAVVVRADGTQTLRAWGTQGGPGTAPVDAEQTVFRIGSITKTFTALAVLQLVDEGRVALDDDVNRHLKGVRAAPFGSPLRVRDLLGHRAGLDGDITFAGLDDAAAAASSSDAALQRDIHALRAPGRVPAYDNMAFGLLGHLLESVDGVPYAQAVQRRILQPLGMLHTRVGLPPQADHTAGAFEVGASGKPEPQPQIHLRRGWQGAGDISSTAGDMARYLRMWLAQGRHEGGQLIKPQTFALMTDTAAPALVPGLPGVGLSVYELGRIGGGGFGHGGTIRGFNAVFMVMPGEGVALFAVMNLNRPAPEFTLGRLMAYLSAPPGRGPIDPTSYLLFDLPLLAEQQWQSAPAAAAGSPATPPAAAQPAPQDSARWVGRYADLRFQTFEALLPRLATALLLPPMDVRPAANGTLTIDGQGPYLPRGPGLFALATGGGALDRIVGFAEVDGQAYGGPHHLLLGRRLAAWQQPWLTGGGLLLAPLLLVLWALLRRPIAGPSAAGPWGVDLGVVLAALALLGALVAEMAWATEWQRVLDHGAVVTAWRLVWHLAVLAIGWRLLQAWRRADGPRPRVHATLGLVLWTWAVWAAGTWHVLGKF